jgi:phage shock protein C
MTPTEGSRQLHRSATDRVVAGVCGGLAESLQVDPTLVRLGFVIATIWGGVGVLAYIILAIVLPLEAEPSPALAEPAERAERTRLAAGIVLVLVGAMLLAGNLGWLPWLTWSLFWPLFLVVVGFVLLVRRDRQAAQV